MRFINEVDIQIPDVKQKFELGDLTIFIGRSNSGKTRILRELMGKISSLKSRLSQYVIPISHTDILANLKKTGLSLNLENNPSVSKGLFITPLLIESPRNPQSSINAFTTSLNKINESAKKIDATITDFGNTALKQKGSHKPLNVQGSGIQNLMQILSRSHEDNNFVLIDEPEISQFPNGKIEILKGLLGLLNEKQVVMATHDPTLINQYLIKKILGPKQVKLIVYSFCGNKFERVDFDNTHDPEIHCGYLGQTYSGKPIHVVVEGQTEYYALQALLTKYCIFKELPYFPKFLNKICISYISGGQWNINLHHLPPPNYYSVLMMLDSEHKQNLDQYSFPSQDFKQINSLSQAADDKTNILCLKGTIEQAFKGIFGKDSFSKPLELSELIWKSDGSICEKLRTKSEESKQIYEVVEWLLVKAGAQLNNEESLLASDKLKL